MKEQIIAILIAASYLIPLISGMSLRAQQSLKSHTSTPYNLLGASSHKFSYQTPTCLFFIQSSKFLSVQLHKSSVASSDSCKSEYELWTIGEHPQDSKYLFFKNVGTGEYLDIDQQGLSMRPNVGTLYDGTKIQAKEATLGLKSQVLTSKSQGIVSVNANGKVGSNKKVSVEDFFIFITVQE